MSSSGFNFDLSGVDLEDLDGIGLYLKDDDEEQEDTGDKVEKYWLIGVKGVFCSNPGPWHGLNAVCLILLDLIREAFKKKKVWIF